MIMDKYYDRSEAGKVLAELLLAYKDKNDVIVLALPRGGVPVGYEIAQRLHVPLDVFIVRKLGVPDHEELAMGALASNHVTVFNDDIINSLHISKMAIENVIDAESKELKRREKAYRGTRPFPDLTGKTVILVDDGIATGATLRAAIKSLKHFKLNHLIVAVPVAAASTYNEFVSLVDKLVCPLRPENFYAVGAWYEVFDQTSDEEVTRLLSLSRQDLGN